MSRKRRKISARQAVPLAHLLPMMIAVVLIHLLGGCSPNETSSKTKSSTSVTDLLAKLPNLRPFGMESCSYTITWSTVSSGKRSVPGPSDTRVELKGSVQLSEEGFKTLKSQFEWAPIPRADVPASLAKIAPSGGLLYSWKLNKSFHDNPDLGADFVVIPAKGDSRSVYFLSSNVSNLFE